MTCKQWVNEPNFFYCACVSTIQQYTGGIWEYDKKWEVTGGAEFWET